jgi:hypothetical protein
MIVDRLTGYLHLDVNRWLDDDAGLCLEGGLPIETWIVQAKLYFRGFEYVAKRTVTATEVKDKWSTGWDVLAVLEAECCAEVLVASGRERKK